MDAAAASPSGGPSIVARGLGKRYGAVRALEGFDLDVRRGEVVGLLGPNGAGKTTALRLLAALVSADAGRASIAGYDAATDPIGVRRTVGFLTATTGLYGRLTVREFLLYFADLCAIERGAARARIDELARELGIDRVLDRRCERLSTGQRQRVNVARAVLHRPRVFLFDEATAGLDLFAARVVHDLVRRARADDAAIVWSTHDMTEAELLCDRMVLLFGGRVVAEGTAEELRARAGTGSLAEAFLAFGEAAT